MRIVPIRIADLEKGGNMEEEKEYLPEQFHMKLRVYKESPNFGKGVVTLLALVKEKGSIAAAYHEMNMASSKAWKIIRKAQEDLGVPLLIGTRGGKSGGGTVLTPEGEDLLARFQGFENQVQEAAREAFDKWFGEKS